MSPKLARRLLAVPWRAHLVPGRLVRPRRRRAPDRCRPPQLTVERDDLALRRDELVLLAVQVANRLLEQPLGLAVLARHAGDRQLRSLPLLVMVDLRHRGAEAILELRL